MIPSQKHEKNPRYLVGLKKIWCKSRTILNSTFLSARKPRSIYISGSVTTQQSGMIVKVQIGSKIDILYSIAWIISAMLVMRFAFYFLGVLDVSILPDTFKEAAKCPVGHFFMPVFFQMLLRNNFSDFSQKFIDAQHQQKLRRVNFFSVEGGNKRKYFGNVVSGKL